MKQYNIEFFDTDFSFIDHSTISGDSLKLSFDYLDPENNKIKLLPPCKGDVNQYIRICGDGAELWGIVTKKDISKLKSGGTIEYTYRDFEDLMDTDIVVDTDRIGVGTMEAFIADTISALYIENADTCQNIPGLTVETISETTDWELDLTPDDEADHYCKAKLLDDIILPAFKTEFIRVLFRFDIGKRKITAEISVCERAEISFETALPNILTSSIKYKLAKKEINKDEIYNKKHYETYVTYYLHPDGTFDTVNADRITPVVRKLETVSTKTAAEYEEKWSGTLTSAANTISSDQAKLDKEEEIDEAAILKEIEAVDTINKIPGVHIEINEATGRVTHFSRSSIVYEEVENESGGLTVIIKDSYDDQAESYTEVENEEGGLTVTLKNIYPDEEPYSKELLLSIIETYATTEMYREQCAQLALEEFLEKAATKAEKTFKANKYENNIELQCLNDDTMLNPLSLEIGQIVNVIDNDNVYQTILSGRKTEKGCTTLIFGTDRLEITKKLKGRA